jgi:hypothetical protein
MIEDIFNPINTADSVKRISEAGIFTIEVIKLIDVIRPQILVKRYQSINSRSGLFMAQ